MPVIESRYTGAVIFFYQGALKDANLRGANLERADLVGANLERANLRGANLRGAKNIPQHYVNLCSRDMLFVFMWLRDDLPRLREKLVAGAVDGTQYVGECCCLIGSLGQGKPEGVERVVAAIPYYEKGLYNYGEQWFFQIRTGDTPDNSFFAKHALTLIDRVLGRSA